MKPYIVRPVEPGKAHVVDRATGAVVGWVVSDYYGNWWPYASVDGASSPLLGPAHQYRAGAAGAVWEAAR